MANLSVTFADMPEYPLAYANRLLAAAKKPLMQATETNVRKGFVSKKALLDHLASHGISSTVSNQSNSEQTMIPPKTQEDIKREFSERAERAKARK